MGASPAGQPSRLAHFFCAVSGRVDDCCGEQTEHGEPGCSTDRPLYSRGPTWKDCRLVGALKHPRSASRASCILHFHEAAFNGYTQYSESGRDVKITRVSFRAHNPLFSRQRAPNSTTITIQQRQQRDDDRSTDNRGNTYQSTRKEVHTSINIQGIMCGSRI